jgi:membrane protease YdiL (CAAX protease family)
MRKGEFMRGLSILNSKSRALVLFGGFILFTGLSFLSKTTPALFGLVVAMGIGLPLGWGFFMGEWQLLGFSKNNLKLAVLWAVATGLLSGLIGLFLLLPFSLPNNLFQQLLVGIPFWLLIISPFQEFFFRGWLQGLLTPLLGGPGSLLLANLGFTLWHYFSPIVDLSPFPLSTPTGFLATFVAGLLYGLAFQKSNHLIAPWLGHALSGVLFVGVGAMDLVTALS